MKTILLTLVTIAVSGLTAAVGYGQVKALQAGSAEAQRAIAEYISRLPIRARAGELSADELAVGACGVPNRIDAKVMQVIDANHMLVGIEDSRNGDRRYRTWIMLKCPTAGITDGKSWRFMQGWERVTGSKFLKVTGTTTYDSAAGGTKTVFVVEPQSAEEFQKVREAARKAAEDALFRNWADSTGKFSVRAKFLAFQSGKVQLERKDDGKKIEIAMSRLSEQDQKWIRDEVKRRAEQRRNEEAKQLEAKAQAAKKLMAKRDKAKNDRERKARAR